MTDAVITKRERRASFGTPPGLEGFEAVWKATSHRAGESTLPDLTGNGHDLDLNVGTTNEPLDLASNWAGTQYAYFPGTVGNNVTVAGLAASTTYDYTVTYLDGSTATGSETTDGDGNLVLGEDQANFVDKSVKDISVEPSGGGSEVAGTAFTDTTAWSEPFASATGRQGLTWTANRSDSGRKLAFVDRPLFLFGDDDFMEAADAAGLDFGAGESFTVIVVFREYGDPANQIYVSKAAGATVGAPGWLYQTDGDSLSLGSLKDGSVRELTTDGPGSPSDPANGTLQTGSVRRDQSADTWEEFLDGVEGDSVADATDDVSNAETLKVGNLPGGFFGDFEFAGAGIVRKALSDADIVTAGNELKKS